MGPGTRIYGIGVIALSMVCFAWGDFDPGQPVPRNFPDRTVLAYLAAGFMLIAGTAIEWRRTAAWGSAALVGYYTLVVVLLMNGRVVLAHPSEYGVYSGAAEQLAIASGGLIVYACSAKIEALTALRLAWAGRCVFGVCALLFGGAHFVYLNLTAPLVPGWLAPTQEFWARATGICQIAAGLALLTGVQARAAAVLLTSMYALFGVLVHAPLLLANHASRMIWSENALNLALVGAALTVADSLTRRRSSLQDGAR